MGSLLEEIVEPVLVEALRIELAQTLPFADDPPSGKLAIHRCQNRLVVKAKFRWRARLMIDG